MTYSQRDPQWKDRPLDASGLTMENFGCVVTAVNHQINRHLNANWNPGQFCDWLNRNAGFDRYGRILWPKVAEYTLGKLRYLGSGPWAKLRKKYTIAQVVFGRFNHWVALLPGGKCMDPWNGVIKSQSDFRFTGQYRYLG